MTLPNAILLSAALLLAAAFLAQRSKLLQLLALCANAVLFWAAFATGSWGLLGINLLLIVLNLRALAGNKGSRKPTRPVAQMDAQVNQRVREISAESRYSSAGIEF